MLKSILEYLNMDESEWEFFKKWETLPEDVKPVLLKMLDAKQAEFDELERELRAYIEERDQHRE